AMIVLVLLGQLTDRLGPAQLNVRRIFGGTPHQAPAQLFTARREQEDERRIAAHAVADALGSLDVDLEHDLLSTRDRLEHTLQGGAVAVRVDIGPLQELAT